MHNAYTARTMLTTMMKIKTSATTIEMVTATTVGSVDKENEM